MKRKFLRYGALWKGYLEPWFGGKPEVPSKEALAYHTLLTVTSERSGKKVRETAKGSLRKFARRRGKELYDSWSRTEGELNYRLEDPLDLTFKAMDAAWAKAFPTSEPPTPPPTKKVELRRKFLPVDLDLAERIKKAADEMGVRGVRVLTDDALEQELAALRLGVTLKQTLDLYDVIKRCNIFGLCLIPMETLNRTVEKMLEKDFQLLLRSYAEAGKALGHYLHTLGEEKSQSLLKGIFATGIFTVTEMGLLRREGGLEIRCVAPVLSMQTTQLLSSYLEGILNPLGFRVAKRECVSGIIKLWAEKKI